MTQNSSESNAKSTTIFDELLSQVMACTERFGHREHIHLTWLAVRLYSVPAAIGLVGDGIQRTARYAGAPQKYHTTISRAWVGAGGIPRNRPRRW